MLDLKRAKTVKLFVVIKWEKHNSFINGNILFDLLTITLVFL